MTPNKRFGFGLAIAFAAVASVTSCNKSNDNSYSRTPEATSTERAKGTAVGVAEQKTVDLSGCLQQGTGSAYILTEMNKARHAGRPRGRPHKTVSASRNFAATLGAYAARPAPLRRSRREVSFMKWRT